jgi:hypothetical protein
LCIGVEGFRIDIDDPDTVFMWVRHWERSCSFTEETTTLEAEQNRSPRGARLFPIRLTVSRTLLAGTFASQGLLDSLLLAGLQIEGVPLNLLDDVLLEDFSLEALERALYTLAIMKVDFSQWNSPSFAKRESPLQRTSFPLGHSGGSPTASL